MKHSVIDFETFYSKKDGISVVKLGNPNYVKATDAYIVAVSVGDEIHCGTIAEMGPVCEQIAKDDTVKPVAANSNFDQSWWEKYFPAFKNEWHCVLDQAVFNQLPRSLPGAVKAALGTEVDKSTRAEMDGVRYEDLPPEKQEGVQNYCATDVIREGELLNTLPDMSPFEERIAAHTRMMNRRGVKINTELVALDKTKLEKMRFEAFKAIPWHADAKPLSYPALVRYCNLKGIPAPKSTAKTDEETTELMTDNPELGAIINNLRRFRRANTMIEKVGSLLDRVTDEGILPLDILYAGAPHTRRWSSKGFNVQNLDKEPLVVTEDGQTVWTRNWLIPRPGHTFLALDYAQIEPRCLNWLVGNEEMMAALRTGFSYYESYARAAKGWKGAAGTIKKELGKEKYTKLKNEALGCGYGMGANKYTTYAHVELSEARAIVAGFRKTNPKVVKFWGTLDNLIRNAARDKSKHLSIDMPTGDKLDYFSIRSNKGRYGGFKTKGDFTGPSFQASLWGGTLTENVTQRMARDVMANAILNLEDAGLHVAFHVHDEIILEVPIVGKEEAKATAFEIMKKAPEWASDLPLDVEGEFADSYTK